MTALEYIANLDQKTGWNNSIQSFQKQQSMVSREGIVGVAEQPSELKQAVVARKKVEKTRGQLILPISGR